MKTGKGWYLAKENLRPNGDLSKETTDPLPAGYVTT